MKYLYFLALAAVLPTASLAQSPANPSGLSVIKMEWRMTHVTPRNSVLLEDPFDAIDKSNAAIRDNRTTVRLNKERMQKGMVPEHPPESVQPPPIPDTTLESSTAYTYQVRVRNDSAKTVRHVVWDYLFLDPVSKEEVGRLSFKSTVDLKPGRSQDLKRKVVSPPTGAVDARTANKKQSELYSERIVIRRVEFTDGSIWQLPIAAIAGTPPIQ